MAAPGRKKKRSVPRPVTYADLCRKPAGEQWEVIDGVEYLMTVPTEEHQHISVQLTRILATFFLNKPCRVFHAPYNVYLPKKDETLEETTNMVVPDLVVICDESKRTSRGCRGAPDLVVEILSPSSLSHDQLRKLNLYESNGVREYWIINPDGIVMVFRLQSDGRHGRPDMYSDDMHLESPLFPGMKINLKEIFPPPPKNCVSDTWTRYNAIPIREVIADDE